MTSSLCLAAWTLRVRSTSPVAAAAAIPAVGETGPAACTVPLSTCAARRCLWLKPVWADHVACQSPKPRTAAAQSSNCSHRCRCRHRREAGADRDRERDRDRDRRGSGSRQAAGGSAREERGSRDGASGDTHFESPWCGAGPALPDRWQRARRCCSSPHQPLAGGRRLEELLRVGWAVTPCDSVTPAASCAPLVSSASPGAPSSCTASRSLALSCTRLGSAAWEASQTQRSRVDVRPWLPGVGGHPTGLVGGGTSCLLPRGHVSVSSL